MTDAITFVSAWFGFALLSLTMKRHAKVLFDACIPSARAEAIRWLLRALGASLLIVSLATALTTSPQLGALHWIAYASLATITVVGILTVAFPKG